MADVSKAAEAVAASTTKALDALTTSPAATSPAPDLWHAAADRLRNTTRWILGVFGVIGVAFLGALPFTGLADLELGSHRAYGAAVGIVLLVGGLAIVLRAGSEVFISRAGTLTEIAGAWQTTAAEEAEKQRETRWRWRKKRRATAAASSEMPPGGTPFGLRYASFELMNGSGTDVSGFVDNWVEARVQLWEARSAAAAAADDKDPRVKVAALAELRFTELDDQGNYLMRLAAYRRVLQSFRLAQLWLFVGAALVTLGATLYFSSVPATAAPDTSATASLTVNATTASAGASCSATPSGATVTLAVPTDRTCSFERVAPQASTPEDEYPSWMDWKVLAGTAVVLVLTVGLQYFHFRSRWPSDWPRTRLFD